MEIVGIGPLDFPHRGNRLCRGWRLTCCWMELNWIPMRDALGATRYPMRVRARITQS
jgi:hypothetical protein